MSVKEHRPMEVEPGSFLPARVVPVKILAQSFGKAEKHTITGVLGLPGTGQKDKEKNNIA